MAARVATLFSSRLCDSSESPQFQLKPPGSSSGTLARFARIGLSKAREGISKNPVNPNLAN